MNPTRRRLLALGGAAVAGSVAGCTGDTGDGSDTGTGEVDGDWAWNGDLPVAAVTQHHHPDCGCCSDYVTYLESNGLSVDVREYAEHGALQERKRELGVPAEMESCHTVEFDDYLVEGHVPLEAIEALFDEEPDLDGISIPGMPQYAPGMGPPSDDPLVVEGFTADGGSGTFVEI